jgi:hypothetical protein
MLPKIEDQYDNIYHKLKVLNKMLDYIENMNWK